MAQQAVIVQVLFQHNSARKTDQGDAAVSPSQYVAVHGEQVEDCLLLLEMSET